MGVGLGAEGIPLRTKLRRESRDGHARRAGSAVDRRIRRLNLESRSAPRVPRQIQKSPQHFAKPTSVQRLRRHGRVELEVEFYGVLQGWRFQAAEWNSLKRSVAYLLEIQRELLIVSA
jgi:hypothetical protein